MTKKIIIASGESYTIHDTDFTGLIEIIVETHASLKIETMHRTEGHTHYRVTIHDGGRLEHTIGLTAGEYFFEYHAVGAASSIYVRGVNRLAGQQKLTIKTVQHHRAPQVQSDLLIKSVLADSASLQYVGTIRIDKNAFGAESRMYAKQLVISPDARVQAEPQLEVLNDDVQCAHGCAIGSVDSDQLRYLHSRGLPFDAAEDLLIMAFVAS